MRRLPRLLALPLIALLTMLSPTAIPSQAAPNRDALQTYHSDSYGVTFQYPAGWQIQDQSKTQTVVVSSADDQKALVAGQSPAGLVFSLTFSTFRQIGAQQVGEFG